VEQEVSTSDLQSVRTLDDHTAKTLLKAKAKGKIGAAEVERIVPVLRETKPERRSIVVQEVMKEHKKAEEFKEEVLEEARAFGRGEIEATSVKLVKDADLKRADKFKETRDLVKYWTVASVEVIENERLRRKAVEYIEDTRDCCEKVLALLKNRKWYGKTG
jgi:hypothetical protein